MGKRMAVGWGNSTGSKDRQARVQITTKPSPPQASPTKASPTKASLLPNCDRVLKSVRNDIGGVAKQRDEDRIALLDWIR